MFSHRELAKPCTCTLDLDVGNGKLCGANMKSERPPRPRHHRNTERAQEQWLCKLQCCRATALLCAIRMHTSACTEFACVHFVQSDMSAECMGCGGVAPSSPGGPGNVRQHTGDQGGGFPALNHFGRNYFQVRKHGLRAASEEMTLLH